MTIHFLQNYQKQRPLQARMELNINEHPPVITAKKIEVYLTET